MAAGRRWLLGAALVRCGVREARRLWLGPVERVVVGDGGSAGLLTVFLNSFSLKNIVKHYIIHTSKKNSQQSSMQRCLRGTNGDGSTSGGEFTMATAKCVLRSTAFEQCGGEGER